MSGTPPAPKEKDSGSKTVSLIGGDYVDPHEALDAETAFNEVGDLFPDAKPHPEQSIPLPTNRIASSIPKASGDPVWTFPSPQRFYNALRRKGYVPNEVDVPYTVMIHNSVNEHGWSKVMEYERLHADECATPTLKRIRGKPGEYSWEARFNEFWGYTLPFDRHDWVVDRCGREVEYILDFYNGPKMEITEEDRAEADRMSAYLRQYGKKVKRRAGAPGSSDSKEAATAGTPSQNVDNGEADGDSEPEHPSECPVGGDLAGQAARNRMWTSGKFAQSMYISARPVELNWENVKDRMTLTVRRWKNNVRSMFGLSDPTPPPQRPASSLRQRPAQPEQKQCPVDHDNKTQFPTRVDRADAPVCPVDHGKSKE